MYRYLFRPLLFLLGPETIHNLLVGLIKVFLKFSPLAGIAGKLFKPRQTGLRREFLGMHFDHPVGLAAGFDKDAALVDELEHFGFSFVEIGTVTPRPQPGNPKPRSFRLPRDQALINRMGFNNQGVEQAAIRLSKSRHRIIIGGNLGKNTQTSNEEAIQDYHFAFEQLYDHVDYLVVNLSCPNIQNLSELQDKPHTLEILHRLTNLRDKKAQGKPILLKISPDLSTEQLDDVIDIFYSSGIDGIIATNTTISREGLSTHGEKVQRIGHGGLSGTPLKDRSTRIIRYLSEKSNGQIPIIGVGGIMSGADAKEKLEAGATLIQVYTGFIYNGPAFVRHINQALAKQPGNPGH